MKTTFDECVESHALRDKLWLSRGKPSYWSLLRKCDPRVNVQAPVTKKQIIQLRKFAGGSLPDSLEDFLLHSNGLFFEREEIVLPADRIIQDTEFMRSLNGFPLDHLLFVGALGDGDMFAFGKNKKGDWLHDVFWWEHETDSLYACGLGIYGYIAARVSWWRVVRPHSAGRVKREYPRD